MSSSSSSAASFWCYRCSRFVRVSAHGSISCPDCSGGFLEELSTPPRLAVSAAEHRRPLPPFPSSSAASEFSSSDSARRRYRRGAAGDLSPFNPVIVLRGASEIEPDRPISNANNRNSFEFFYDDGAGSGLRPLPSTVSDFLMGSGFDRLLGQLSQMETNGGVRAYDHPPASKAAVESMPTINIDPSHVGMDSYCAVCMEKFELGAEAREMPCKHIYHQDCILPWLSLRNSCPVCRHELPTDVRRRNSEVENDDESVGLTIWRLPGGGFAVGRFAGGRRPGERDLPVVYTEMDGGFNSGGAPRRISWPARGSRSRESGGFVRTLRNLFSFRCFGGSSGSSSLSAGASASRSLSTSSTMQNRRAPMSRRRRRDSRRDSNGWALEDGSGNSISRW
ncbi:putative E3 ubiquitin-protein ligase RING1 [Iris pallida]|uniref:RING-type E3 ubiquitin transferase n=1 Tax=Iris pallida TaxID=29817 RepID=A0AAX6I6Y1_IRIPA|nr:putative E3 ubiquitin-protein ligase RING1 [Iris pallida]KAJ6848627.1 putative E3 ubiquitin-protein ligase RING1 [Iris pallida]